MAAPSGFAERDPLPTSREVTRFHSRSDVDSSAFAQHHTLGTKPNQAASGSHKHDGLSGLKLLDGVIISGSRGGNAALESVIAALVQLGATDSTSP